MTDKLPKRKLDPTGTAVAIGAVAVLLVIGTAGFSILNALVNPGQQVLTKDENEAKTLEFCRSVRQTISADDKVCGKYVAQIDAEIEQSKQAEAQQAEENKAAAEEAANPYRTISRDELRACRRALQNSMKDPRSFRENNSTEERGGLIDYTATNSLGGPVRSTFRCTTLQNITSS